MKEYAWAGRSFAVVASAGALAVLAAAAASGALAGGSASSCPPQALVQPFQAWGDRRSYFLAPGGDMESSWMEGQGWDLDGEAERAPGNEPWYVSSADDRFSLALGQGGSATTPAICVTVHSPTIRFFLRNSEGVPDAALRVDLIYTDREGQERAATVAELRGGSSWAVSRRVLFLNEIAPVVGGRDRTWVRFRLSPIAGSWQIDDLYVDPLKSV